MNTVNDQQNAHNDSSINNPSIFDHLGNSKEDAELFISRLLKKQAQQLEKVHKVELSNVKLVAIQESIWYIK